MEEFVSCSVIKIKDIPVLTYEQFFSRVDGYLCKNNCHCVNYFIVPFNSGFMNVCCIADDENHKILVLAHKQSEG